METGKQVDADKAILKAICKLMLCDTDAELAAVVESHQELLTERAKSIFAVMIGDIPESETFIRGEWGRRAEFLAGKVGIFEKS